MKESFSSNPSEAFANASREHYDTQNRSFAERAQQKESILDSESAAYAAKPWMDVAVELYDIKNRIGEYGLSDEGEPGMDHLTHYAERRANQVVEGSRGGELTGDEEALLDVFKAEAAMYKAQEGFDIGAVSEDTIETAMDMARRKAWQARSSGDRAEAQRWDAIARQADGYGDMMFQGMSRSRLEEGARDELDDKIWPNAHRAGMELEFGLEDGVSKDPTLMRRALLDADNMRKTTEVYKLFAEIQREASTPEQKRETHSDVVETLQEAREKIYNDPELLSALTAESSAYADFLSDDLGDRDNQLQRSRIKAFKNGADGLTKMIDTWEKNRGQGDFRQYVEAITSGDIAATDEEFMHASDASRLMKLDEIWRGRAMARRMARQVTDKHPTSLDKNFSDLYFR